MRLNQVLFEKKTKFGLHFKGARISVLAVQILISEEKIYSAEFYTHGSVHRESNLITIQQDATYSVYYISVGRSTYFGC